MSGLSSFSDRGDVLEENYLSKKLTVGDSSEVLAATGGSTLVARQNVLIYSKAGNSTIFFGPSGVTAATSGTNDNEGIPINGGELVILPLGNLDIYLIAASGTSNEVIIQELA